MAVSPARQEPLQGTGLLLCTRQGQKFSNCVPCLPLPSCSILIFSRRQSPHAQVTKRTIMMGPFRQETVLTHGRNGFVPSRPTRPFSIRRPYYENSKICPTITTHPSQVLPKENVAYRAEQLRAPSYRDRLSIWPCLHDSIAGHVGQPSH